MKNAQCVPAPILQSEKKKIEYPLYGDASATSSTFGNFSVSTTVYLASLQQIYTPLGGITYLGWGWPDQTEIVFQTNMTGQLTYFTPILIE